MTRVIEPQKSFSRGRVFILVLVLWSMFIFPGTGVWGEANTQAPEGVAVAPKPECVVLLHGLARSHRSMKKMAKHLEKEGFQVFNIGYPSRDFPIEKLGAMVEKKMEEQGVWQHPKVHFVTHSMGGIVVRYIFREEVPDNMGRVVMLSPPNHGSEIVDHLGDWSAFEWVNGPAGSQLDTAADSLPNHLGPPKFSLGVITGNKGDTPFFSDWIPGPDDGKVSVEGAKLAGMEDFLVVPHSHTFIMNKPDVMENTARFLKTGVFKTR